MDIFILGGRRLEGCLPGSSNRLYHNNRDGTFTDVTEKAGLIDCGWAYGVCVGDYNNDGFEDLFLTYYGQNKLYRNNGDGTFTDVTEKAACSIRQHVSAPAATFVDYNRDGLLDLFVSNYRRSIDWRLRQSRLWTFPTVITRVFRLSADRRVCGAAALPVPQ